MSLVNEQLVGTRNILIKEITSLNNAQFNERLDTNTWSIAQVCHHLILVEQSTIKAITWGLIQVEPSQTERKNVQLMMDRTKKYKAPNIVEPDVGPYKVQSIVNLLNDSRNKLLAFLNTIEIPSILKEKSFKHPVLGKLPLDQWIDQVYLHEQRHIEQIKEIKINLLFDSSHSTDN